MLVCGFKGHAPDMVHHDALGNYGKPGSGFPDLLQVPGAAQDADKGILGKIIGIVDTSDPAVEPLDEPFVVRGIQVLHPAMRILCHSRPMSLKKTGNPGASMFSPAGWQILSIL